MKPYLLTNLPSEIIAIIFSKLSIPTIAISKCVCRSWLDLLEDDYFINSYTSKLSPALAVMLPLSPKYRCKFFELEDDLDLDRHSPLTGFDFLYRSRIEASANGLLILGNYEKRRQAFYVCNPITRETILLHSVPVPVLEGFSYGFGKSRISGQFKFVIIDGGFGYYVYTLGTGGSWRCVAQRSPISHAYRRVSFGKLVNGNLHWVAPNSRFITSFDLETECFSTFSGPPRQGNSFHSRLLTLGDCLCFCERSSVHEMVIWLVKDYEIDKSWTKEFVIPLDFVVFGGVEFAYIQPLKAFANGDILMLCDYGMIFYYSNSTKAYRKISLLDECKYLTCAILTPTFLSLKSFAMEKVESF
ncbi:peptide-methionine (R)-S-oxide reductase [Salvia divinorum]|uniref:Peptide-methionine (R)-S-oxide reductase n=1 Tax=Salvia divinorum TaxID=28513 RepID=A0ABD1GL17_SALDI